MVKKRIAYNGRSDDYEFKWLSDRGPEWKRWASLMSRWIGTRQNGVHHRMRMLLWFVNIYLPVIPESENPDSVFKLAAQNRLPDIYAMLLMSMSETTASNIFNYLSMFWEWIIEVDYSVLNEQGIRMSSVYNPFPKRKLVVSKTESVYTPLPFSYIKELREILCPVPRGDFRDWNWAQVQSGQIRSNGREAARGGDWFEFPEHLLDFDDPDCVWRKRVVKRIIDSRQVEVELTELWSPVRSVALLLKLHLPLRTYQIRMLDSGEADTWRYSSEGWKLNDQHEFSQGSERNPWNRGVFSRLRSLDTGEVMTGLYVNTNKTADQNKDGKDRGYTIPWQNEDVLHWLEKLRNWQEKYNPIQGPTPCAELNNSTHIGFNKTLAAKREMGAICFLFRDASYADKAGVDKPITRHLLDTLWYKLLSTLEGRVFDRGQTLSDGSKLEFVEEYSEDRPGKQVATHFPLHSLRVSLLTCYAMEGGVPMPVLSKLLAGHSRLLMTLYYTKPSVSAVTEALDDAEEMIEQSQDESLRVFLKDASLRQIKSVTVFRDEASIDTVLSNRNPIGWEHRHIGLCLVGGNSVRNDEKTTVAGCWNGGEMFGYRGMPIYNAVPHGPENCIRCRWFITDARYLNALTGHFNNISYRASLAAKLALEHEQERDALLEERYFAEENGVPFLKQAELQKVERRYEKQVAEADEFAKDLVACFQTIGRIIAIEEQRDESDSSDKLVATGSLEDIRYPISFIETESELLQLSQVCEDAEIFPELADNLRKSPAIEKRSRTLNKLLMKEGYVPIFMQMDERMQLIAGNAMMRSMAKAVSSDQIEGFRKVAGMIESGQYLGLLPKGIEAVERIVHMPMMKLSELITSDGKVAEALVHG